MDEKNGQPVFILQRNYSQPRKIDLNTAQELEKETLEKFVKTLNEKHNLNARIVQKGEGGIAIAGSHNPEGRYNDLARGQRGQ